MRSEPDVEVGDPGSAPRRPRGVRVAVVVAASVVAALAILQLWTRGATTQPLTVADYVAQARSEDGPAPDFTLPLLSGDGELTLSSLRGSVVVLNFWASWCGPCREEAPGLVRASRAYRADGVRFLGVNERDDPAAARAFVEEFGIPFPSVVDDSGSLADDYALIGMPTTVIVSSRGELVYRFTGYVDAGLLRGSLDDVLGREGRT